MRVIRADVMGMCFGVRDALKVIEGISDPQGVTIHGQLVHNEVVLDDLKARGFAMQDEPTGDRSGELVPGGERVLITAHGISDRERRLLESAGKTLIDTTCPLVMRVHQAAQALQAQGYHVLVIGRKAHVEVQGIIDDLTSVNVIESEARRAAIMPGRDSASSARRRQPNARSPRSGRQSPRETRTPRSGTSTAAR